LHFPDFDNRIFSLNSRGPFNRIAGLNAMNSARHFCCVAAAVPALTLKPPSPARAIERSEREVVELPHHFCEMKNFALPFSERRIDMR
jgi:hypothetical protein